MKLKQTGIALAAVSLLLASLSALGCGTTAQTQRNPVIQNDPGKDYATVTGRDAELFREGGKGSLTINNLASFDVILFAGKVANDNVLGGIRAGKSRTFDISALPLPAKNGSFLIRAASYTTYTRKSRRVTEADVLYTSLVVYDLDDPRDATNINIYAGINQEQNEYIYVSNTSRFVLELRVDNPNGEKLATIAPFQENKRVFLTPLPQGMPYSFYATYVYIDPSTSEVKSFSAKSRAERQRRIPDAESVNPMVFSGPKDTSDISYQLGFFRVKNDVSEGFNFMDGTEWLADQKGRRLVASGQMQTFELPSLSGDAGQLYTNLNLEFDSAKTLRLDRVLIKPGVVYDVSITEQGGGYAYDIRETAYKDKLEDMQVTLFLGD
ncbi:MAG: hypothetical protein LBP80_12445 [Treponema sp.]|jgi:hypothetical protein|nr:hypothetical protein [Treponema sp.]